ncbi:hypothetical protein ACON3F_10385 [Providencia hangzhouensis]|uniref:hypothetical protein n=1 Tax=Providencia TaxID=586 RepID=UPI000D8A7413|nr:MULTISPECIES: hypothetical protein [Providencia]MBG5892209.1 hypothetical protein [Providencia rettgeri]PYZ60039.1 hypothetical protein DNK63_13385 [Providencia rettgeri]QIF65376.1 hypothetical protein FVA72_07475 [Providencia sp. 1709051003]WOB96587.1 hypothetical protein P3L54_07160 [Providencia sp. PROV099]
MSGKLGHLESYQNSLIEIKNLLEKDDALYKLFLIDETTSLDQETKSCLAKFIGEVRETIDIALDRINSFDEYCKITGNFRLAIKTDTPSNIMLSYIIIIRYIIEYLIVVPDGMLNDILSERVRYLKKNRHLFLFLEDRVKFYLEYSIDEYSGYIYSILIGNLNFVFDSKFSDFERLTEIEKNINLKHEEIVLIGNKVTDFNEEVEDLFNEKSKFIKDDLEVKQKKIDELKKYLENLSSGYNFAGLTKAYHDIYSSKSKERWISLAILFLLAFVSICPIGYKIITEKADEFNDVMIFKYIGYSALTIISLYFFRVSLQNYNSIKAELTQINLRKNLCMFVDNYSDFSKTKDNREALEKFENIIFSNIQLNENNIPSTFDGLEQLASLIESLSKRK